MRLGGGADDGGGSGDLGGGVTRISKEDLDRKAEGRWPAILEHLGGVDGKVFNHVKHQACPNCGGVDRFRWDDRNGRGDYFCNQCGAGDGWRLLMLLRGWDFPDAIRAVAEYLGEMHFEAPPPREKLKQGESHGTACLPIPETAPDPPTTHPKMGRPSKVWTYRDLAGKPLFHVARFDFKGGKKVIMPLSFRRAPRDEAGRELPDQWRWVSVATPRPLYNLPKLATSPAAPVLLVEGEKCADRAQAAFPGLAVLAWPNGCKAISTTNWRPLKGRTVIYWPDQDQGGRESVEKLQEKLQAARVASLAVVEPPAGLPDGWDVYDALEEETTWGRAFAQDLISKARVLKAEPPPKAAKPTEPVSVPAPAEEARGAVAAAPRGIPASITALGYADGVYYYLPANAPQVRALRPSSHQKLDLLSLAPLFEWERHFEGEVSWLGAANNMMQACHRAGVWSTDRVRGRGCWSEDGGRVAVHLGDSVLMGDRAFLPGQVKSRWVYPAAKPLPRPAGEITRAQVEILTSACALMSWEQPVSAQLLCGWLALAPICGALEWRPHIWLVGGAGTGKSTILDRFIAFLLGDIALEVQGSSTEAGLRQELRGDARPVIFDEAEGNGPTAKARIEMILELMRQSSSQSGGRILKGSASHQVQAFSIRSMFCLASIASALTRQADASRCAVLALRTPSDTPASKADAEKRWLALQDLLAQVNPAMGQALFGRMVRMVPVVHHNTRTLATALVRRGWSQRDGDQYGALLAGTAALCRDEPLDVAGADAWVESLDWAEHEDCQYDDDSLRALTMFRQWVVRIDTNDYPADVTVAELVYGASAYSPEGGVPGMERRIDRGICKRALQMRGILVKEGEVWVSQQSEAIKAHFASSDWGNDWKRVLQRLPGAKPARGYWRRPLGHSRGVSLPLRLVAGEEIGPAELVHNGTDLFGLGEKDDEDRE